MWNFFWGRVCIPISPWSAADILHARKSFLRSGWHLDFGSLWRIFSGLLYFFEAWVLEVSLIRSHKDIKHEEHKNKKTAGADFPISWKLTSFILYYPVKKNSCSMTWPVRAHFKLSAQTVGELSWKKDKGRTVEGYCSSMCDFYGYTEGSLNNHNNYVKSRSWITLREVCSN